MNINYIFCIFMWAICSLQSSNEDIKSAFTDPPSISLKRHQGYVFDPDAISRDSLSGSYIAHANNFFRALDYTIEKLDAQMQSVCFFEEGCHPSTLADDFFKLIFTDMLGERDARIYSIRAKEVFFERYHSELQDMKRLRDMWPDLSVVLFQSLENTDQENFPWEIRQESNETYLAFDVTQLAEDQRFDAASLLVFWEQAYRRREQIDDVLQIAYDGFLKHAENWSAFLSRCEYQLLPLLLAENKMPTLTLLVKELLRSKNKPIGRSLMHASIKMPVPEENFLVPNREASSLEGLPLWYKGLLGYLRRQKAGSWSTLEENAALLYAALFGRVKEIVR